MSSKVQTSFQNFNGKILMADEMGLNLMIFQVLKVKPLGYRVW